MTSFEELRRVNTTRCQRWHPGFPDNETWTIADWACALAGEAGEAANVVKKIRRIDLDTLSPTGARSRENDRKVHLPRLGEELADTVIYADLLAAKAHIDLAQWVRMKFNGVSIREGWPERLRERAMSPLAAEEAPAPCSRCWVTTPVPYLDSAGVCTVCREKEGS